MKLLKTLTALLVVTATVYFSASTDADQSAELTEHPGYFSQYMEMKANSNGEIPGGLRTRWNEQSKLLKTGNGLLENIEQVGGPIKTNGGISFGGRTRAILIDQRDPNTIWAAAISGGLWKSKDGGSTWNPVNDYSSSLAVTCLAQNPFNPQEIVYGTGEGRGNSAGVPGEGVFISKDGGETFERMSSTEGGTFEYIWDVEYSKTEPGAFYIATDAANPSNTQNKYGLYKRVPEKDSVVRLFASSGRLYRVQTLPDSTIFFTRQQHGVYRGSESNPGAFNRLTNGLPTTSIGRCNVAYCKAEDSTLYLSLYHASSDEIIGIYRTDDRGETWSELTNPDRSLTTSFRFGWYAHLLDVSPIDPDIVIIGYQYAAYTVDGGQTWRTLSNSHADYHIATFYPNTSNALVGNDGGVFRYTYNNSSRSFSYTSLNDQYNTFQYYAGTYYPEGENIVGGTQDNGTWGGMNDNDFYVKHNEGDGAYCEVDALAERLYYSSQNGVLGRKNLTTSSKTSLYRNLTGSTGTSDFWFINPFTINRKDGAQLYFPTKNYIARTTDAGNTFQLITERTIGSTYAIATSEADDPILYFGGASGTLYRLDGGKTAVAGDETRLDQGIAPSQARGFIANIAIDPNEDSTIYLAMSNTSVFSSIWKVTRTHTSTPVWESIGSNLPEQLPVNWIEVDPLNSDHIIAATDFGLYTTVNGGGWWEKVEGIPNVSIHMIKLRNSDRKLFIYTHGRGAWTADLSNQVTSSPTLRKEEGISLYPNPVVDFLNIEGVNRGTALLHDLTGRVVKEAKVEAGQVDLSALGNGTYLIHVQGESLDFVRKIVVNR